MRGPPAGGYLGEPRGHITFPRRPLAGGPCMSGRIPNVMSSGAGDLSLQSQQFSSADCPSFEKIWNFLTKYTSWEILPIWETFSSLHLCIYNEQKLVTFWESLSHFYDLIQNVILKTKNIFLHNFSGRVRICNHFLCKVIFQTPTGGPREIITRGSCWG